MHVFNRIGLAGMLWLGLSSSLFSQTPVQKHGALRIEGNQIVDKNGQPPQLRGISFSWSVWGGRKYYTTDVVDHLCKDFQTTLLRASMAVQPDSGYLQQPEAQMALITRVVDQAIKNGVYILIDWHDHNAEQHVQESKAFFRAMAQRYAGNPQVIYEIWNEPERQTWPVIKAYSEEVIREIRTYDPKNLIIVGSPHWDQDVDVAAADPIKGQTNLAYSFHFYASEPYHQDGLRAKAEKAMQLGLPLMVTEWGVGESSGDGKFDREQNRIWLNWMEKHRLSWVNWNITDKKETTAILQPGAPANGKWTKEHLTPAGIYIQEQLHQLQKSR